ncbi:hypothetical protein Patl1_00189 [Pistacia atlantica]|uniref:Uncharacterized protein n=1 Tax=Pistacia atlantica TaxID=434234 RepID=A0ACC1C9X1_9ROSI|nr:hypothetical protein Patl1_00189 [Pistacia atlantica]
MELWLAPGRTPSFCVLEFADQICGCLHLLEGCVILDFQVSVFILLGYVAVLMDATKKT